MFRPQNIPRNPLPTNAQSRAFSSPSNSFQSRYTNNSFNLNQHWTRAQNNSVIQRRGLQFYQNNSPRALPSYVPPVISNSNTDVTMRTASSRRINYTDNNHGNLNNPQIEDFDLRKFSNTQLQKPGTNKN